MFAWGAVWTEEVEGVREVQERGLRGSVGARGVGFTRVRVIELDEVLLNPA